MDFDTSQKSKRKQDASKKYVNDDAIGHSEDVNNDDNDHDDYLDDDDDDNDDDDDDDDDSNAYHHDQHIKINET